MKKGRRSHTSARNVGADVIDRISELDFPSFVERLTSGRSLYPRHFQQIVDLMLDAPGKGRRICFAAPRQHGKTTLLRLLMAWWQLHFLDARIYYATYAQEYTEIQTRELRHLVAMLGRPIASDHNTLKGWTFDDRRSAFIGSSVEGPGNGLGANIIVVDDPFSGPDEAYNASRRDQVYRWFREVVIPMAAPGASIIVVASRWHVDDLSGRLIEIDGFDEVRIPAINDGIDPNRQLGEPLCPWGPNPREPRDLKFLLDLRDGPIDSKGERRGGVGDQAWCALYQGLPLPPPNSIFRIDPRISIPLEYETPPESMFVTIGCDLGYSDGKRSDWTAGVVLGQSDGILYLLDSFRVKLAPSIYIPLLKGWMDRWPGAKAYSFMSGPEKAVIYTMLHSNGLIVYPLPAVQNKAVRALKVAQAWNEKLIAVPKVSPWRDVFMRELGNFTGTNDEHDDQVDALTSAFAMAMGAVKSVPWTAGRRVA